jgi:nicotinate phosphoribosyltransferase
VEPIIVHPVHEWLSYLQRKANGKGVRMDVKRSRTGSLGFNTASEEEIKSAAVADVYFQRAMQVLRSEGKERTPVHAEVVLKSSELEKWYVLAGLDEVAHLLEDTEIEAYALPEGTICRPQEPVLTLSGPYEAFGEHETAILGFLCQASGVATGAARCRLAAGERRLISFGARRMHPAIGPMIERAAYLGGCDGVAETLGAERLGIQPVGTLPHALVLILGSTEKATRAFDRVVEEEVPRTILIDTFDDEKFGALIAAEAIPDSIFAVRLDTPSDRRGNFKSVMREVRWELDRAGFSHVKIFASGGIDTADILELNPLCDAYGVGGAIAAAPIIDFSLDIVEVDGEPRAKRGKWSGRKRLLELKDRSHKILPAEAEPSAGAKDLLQPLDQLYASPPDVSSLRERVLEQLATGDFNL